MRRICRLAFVVAAVTPGLLIGQVPQISSSNEMSANSIGIAAVMEPVSGQPYQAEKLTTSVQKLWDGTVITHETKSTIARDANGRVREDVYTIHSGSVGGKQQNASIEMTSVSDPVEHTVLFWHTGGLKTAMMMKMPSLPKLSKSLPGGGVTGGVALGQLGGAPPPPPGMPTHPRASGPAKEPADEVRTEDLGGQSMEGVMVTGKRVTTVIPTGKIGNDRPITIVHEEWTSGDLKVVVKSVDSDPRTGERTMELKNLSRTDPEAAFFQVPEGYKVTDMAEMMKKLGDIGRTPAK